MNTINTKTLKPGDSVGVSRHSIAGLRTTISTVERVTPSGIVHLAGDHGLLPFNARGERKVNGSSYRRVYLITVEEAERRLAEDAAQETANKNRGAFEEALRRIMAVDPFTSPGATLETAMDLRALADAVEARDYALIAKIGRGA